jgi:hypothetical protein
VQRYEPATMMIEVNMLFDPNALVEIDDLAVVQPN